LEDRVIALRVLCLLAVSLLVAACTAPTRAPATGDDCASWFGRLDGAVDAAGVRDAQEERIDGYPGLRVDRLGVATRHSTAFDAWLERAIELDRGARDAEIANLPRGVFPLDGAADAAAARARSDSCRAAWHNRLNTPAQRQALLDQATVPDSYVTPLRALGLYPIVRVPFLHGVERWQQEHRQTVAAWARSAPPVQRFVPRDDDAPVFEIEAHDGGLAAFDRFGVPTWTAQAAPRVDTTQPVAYQRESRTLYRGQMLTQRVFTLWFPERPPRGWFDLLAGSIDGLVVRLTYAADGTPLMVDTIHACGCYHLFFPADGVRLRNDLPAHEEPVFIPTALPQLHAGERLVVRISSAAHYVTAVARDSGRTGMAFTLRDDDELRSLPLPDGGRRSLYDADGFVAGSERGERLLFWPMGIANAGAMRQWGHHATAFIGRRHFDDTDLIERRFSIPDLK
jgi:hypothetical protein